VSSLDTSTRHVELFSVTLVPEISRHERRWFFRAMSGALRRQGLSITQKFGLVVITAIDPMPPRTVRHAVVTWLVDQRQVERILLNESMPIDTLLTHAYTVSCQGALLSPETTQVAQELIDHMLFGAIRQFARLAKDEGR
jgi:hypothetical protein